MSDLLDEQLRDRFARFRGEAQESLRPPGVQAARQTVARRRRGRSLGAAAGLLLITAGGWVLRAVEPGPPAAPAADVAALRQEASARVGTAGPSALLAVTTHAQSHTFGPAYPPGSYVLTVACAGQGWVAVAWHTSTDVNGNGDVACNGGAVHDTIPLRLSGAIDVTVTGDDRAAASSAQVAIAVTNPNVIAATAALPEHGEAVLVNAGDTAAASLDTTVAPGAGAYHLSLVCVGTGLVRVALSDPAGAAADVRDLGCTDSGAAVELTVSTAAGTDLTVTVNGWPGTEAGYAYRLWRS